MHYTEPWEAEEMRQAKADRGAIRCDCCGGMIRRGETKYTLAVGDTELVVCEDCKGYLVASEEVHGYEGEF